MILKNKNAIVTGGAMGIGFATCKRLVKAGCNVTLWDINETALKNAKVELEKLYGKVFIYVCDVTDKNRVTQLVQQAKDEMGSIDILINNAGYIKKGNLLDQQIEDWQRTIDVNFSSLLFTIYAVLPEMYKRNAGHIVNISSAAGLIGVGGMSVYAATKWAVFGLTESLRFESLTLGKNGVKWSSIHPSYLAHGMFEGAKLNFLGNLFIPLVKNHDVIAKAIVYDALIKEKNVVRRPITLRLSVILRGIFPDWIFQKILVLMGVHKSMDNFKGRMGV